MGVQKGQKEREVPKLKNVTSPFHPASFSRHRMDQKGLRSEDYNFWIRNSRQLQFFLSPHPTPRKWNRNKQIIANSSHLNLRIRNGNSIENIIFFIFLRKKYIFNSVISFPKWKCMWC